MKNPYFLLIMLATVSFGITGCTHEMQIENIKDYEVTPVTGVPVDVAIAAKYYSLDEAVYFDAFVTALRGHPHVNVVRTSWSQEKEEKGFNPGYIVSLDINPAYEGSGDNWIITWPGCYIFTCAWAGYKYSANVITDVNIVPCDKSSEMMQKCGVTPQEQSESIACDFTFRHCDFGRGFWSGSGWWMPGFGLHNIFVGMFYTDYEPKATEPFHTAVDDTYGKYIANKIVEMLVNGGAEEHAKAVKASM